MASLTKVTLLALLTVTFLLATSSTPLQATTIQKLQQQTPPHLIGSAPATPSTKQIGEDLDDALNEAEDRTGLSRTWIIVIAVISVFVVLALILCCCCCIF